MDEEIIKEDLSKNKKISPELKIKRRKILFKNIMLIILILLYLLILTMAFYKMELNTLATDLKVISVGLLVFAIYKFENGYKNDNEGTFLTGVEALLFALFTLFMTALISEEEQLFKNVILGTGIVSTVYYLSKSYVLRRKIKKEHKKKISDVRDIVWKGEI